MKFRLIIIALITLTSCYNIDRNCNDYKIGSYYSEVVIDSTIFKSEFTRNTKIQVEYYNKRIDSSEVRWLNDCGF